MNISEWEPSFYCSSDAVVEKPIAGNDVRRRKLRIRIRRGGAPSNREHNQQVLEVSDKRREMCCNDHNFFAGNPLD
jgi:hypothetical protein